MAQIAFFIDGEELASRNAGHDNHVSPVFGPESSAAGLNRLDGVSAHPFISILAEVGAQSFLLVRAITADNFYKFKYARRLYLSNEISFVKNGPPPFFQSKYISDIELKSIALLAGLSPK